MKLGGLFSGVGGFELAWQQAGGEIAWMCEVDKKAQAVLRERFPGVTIYDDVRKLDPTEVEAVDILTGGSPCQGFSVAGKRTGLGHAESTLFHDYVRILDGLAERGLRWAVWENVPGVLSIKNPDGERTFPHVIAALAGAAEPVPLDPRRKWNVGMATHGRREVAWRVLDSQHFGVAQRRRRVFACVALGHPDAGAAGRALLAVTEGVRGDTAPSEPSRQEAPGAVAEGARSAGVGCEFGPGGGRFVDVSPTLDVKAKDGPVRGQVGVAALAPTVSAKWAKGTGGPAGDETQNLTLDAPQSFKWQQGDAEYTLRPNATAITDGSQPAILLGVAHPPVVPIQDTRPLEKAQGGLGVGEEGDPSYTLDTVSRAGVGPVAYWKSKRAQSSEDDETWVDDGKANTLNTFDASEGRTSHAVVEPDLADGFSYDGYNQKVEHGVHRPIRIGRDSSDFVADDNSIRYGVRRLTPVECERLQGFPDGWTDVEGASDASRYRAMGNAVTVPTVRWILTRVREQEAARLDA